MDQLCSQICQHNLDPKKKATEPLPVEPVAEEIAPMEPGSEEPATLAPEVKEPVEVDQPLIPRERNQSNLQKKRRKIWIN